MNKVFRLWGIEQSAEVKFEDLSARIHPADNRSSIRWCSISQGEYEVLDEPDAVITTVLGSCVSVCLRDPKLGVGGMNHFVLPSPSGNAKGVIDPTRYGYHLTMLLLKAMLQRGANIHRIEAKVFGGADTPISYYKTGQRNADFAIQFLQENGIALALGEAGGAFGCRLDYWPVSGKTRRTVLEVANAPRR